MSHEVVSIFDMDQFDSIHSKDRCGPASVALMASANALGKSPLHNLAWAEEEMHTLYTHFVTVDPHGNPGSNLPSDLQGTGMQQLYNMIRHEGLHFQNLFPDGPVNDLGVFNGQLQGHVKASMREFLKRGYAVIIACTEDSVFDMKLGRKPYGWPTTHFNHIITVTGLADNGIDFLVRDTANVGNPGPRVYAATQLNLISATVVGLASQTRPSADNNGHPNMS